MENNVLVIYVVFNKQDNMPESYTVNFDYSSIKKMNNQEKINTVVKHFKKCLNEFDYIDLHEIRFIKNDQVVFSSIYYKEIDMWVSL